MEVESTFEDAAGSGLSLLSTFDNVGEPEAKIDLSSFRRSSAYEDEFAGRFQTVQRWYQTPKNVKRIGSIVLSCVGALACTAAIGIYCFTAQWGDALSTLGALLGIAGSVLAFMSEPKPTR